MQITGKITNLSEVELVGQKQTEKVTARIEEVEGDYPNSLIIDFLSKGVAQLEGYRVGDMVTVEYKAKTTDYNGRTYNNIKGWKVTPNGKSVKAAGDDLPF